MYTVNVPKPSIFDVSPSSCIPFPWFLLFESLRAHFISHTSHIYEVNWNKMKCRIVCWPLLNIFLLLYNMPTFASLHTFLVSSFLHLFLFYFIYFSSSSILSFLWDCFSHVLISNPTHYFFSFSILCVYKTLILRYVIIVKKDTFCCVFCDNWKFSVADKCGME